MKQKDLMPIIVVAFVGAIISVIVTNKLFTNKVSQEQAEIVQPISASFPTPDKTYFNSQSIDPSQLIKISDNNNPHPFNGTGSGQ